MYCLLKTVGNHLLEFTAEEQYLPVVVLRSSSSSSHHLKSLCTNGWIVSAETRRARNQARSYLSILSVTDCKRTKHSAPAAVAALILSEMWMKRDGRWAVTLIIVCAGASSIFQSKFYNGSFSLGLHKWRRSWEAQHSTTPGKNKR